MIAFGLGQTKVTMPRLHVVEQSDGASGQASVSLKRGTHEGESSSEDHAAKRPAWTIQL